MTKKISYSKFRKLQRDANGKFCISEFKKNMANTMYKILVANHKGEDNAISGDNLAIQMSSILDYKVTDVHVRECTRLFRQAGRFLSLQTCHKGYYVDNSYEAKIKTLRMICNQVFSLQDTIKNIAENICFQHGQDAIPSDLKGSLEMMNVILAEQSYSNQEYDEYD